MDPCPSLDCTGLPAVAELSELLFSSCDLEHLTYDLDLQFQSIQCHDELACKISRSKIISFKIYCSNTQIQKRQTDCCMLFPHAVRHAGTRA